MRRARFPGRRAKRREEAEARAQARADQDPEYMAALAEREARYGSPSRPRK